MGKSTKHKPTTLITSRKAQIAAKLFEKLYSDHDDPGIRRMVKAWVRTLSKAQKLKQQDYKVSVPFRPGRPQLIVVKGKR